MSTIVIVEDHRIFREGLRRLLEDSSRFQVVGEAADGKTGIRLVDKLKPDLLLLDLILPGLHGFQVLRKVHQLTKALVLSVRTDESFVVEAFRYGAAGYVAKDDSFADLLKGIETVLKGERFFSPSLNARHIITRLGDKPAVGTATRLTPREHEVLQMAAQSSTSSEIAHALSISPRTVEMHRANLMRKLSLRSQGDLVRFAIRNKIIPA